MRSVYFGQVVRARRELLKESQKDLAERLGISPQYLCDIEAGKRYPNLFEAFAKALRFQPDYLYALAGLLPPRLVILPDDQEMAVCVGLRDMESVVAEARR